MSLARKACLWTSLPSWPVVSGAGRALLDADHLELIGYVGETIGAEGTPVIQRILRRQWGRLIRPGVERKLVRKYGAFGLLVVDEWLLDKPDTEFRSMLLELIELRCGTASTVFCTQFKKKDWHPRLGGGVHADAIVDRIVHSAVWFDMGEANMRQRRG